jgi:hypothetical protein
MLCSVAVVILGIGVVQVVDGSCEDGTSRAVETSTDASPKKIEATFDVTQWNAAGIGIPKPAGSQSWDGATLRLTGAGAGLNIKGKDEAYFAYVRRQAGDFEMVARFVVLMGEGDAAAGIMARSDNTPASAMTALFFNGKENTLGWMARPKRREGRDESGKAPRPSKTQGVPPKSPSPAKAISSSIGLAKKPPLWLKMVRLGKNFAVYKSRDGKLWSMISNVSGGPFPIEGPLELGFFVTSTNEKKTVTARFDSIRIGDPNLRYRTSWVGNSFGCRKDDNHVSNNLAAMWVAADGTCYTSSYWDEAGQPVTSYRDGKVARPLPVGTPQTAEGGITGDDKHIYVAAVDRIIELDPAAVDFTPKPLVLSVRLHDKKTNQCVVSGLASNGRELFVADSRDNLIRVVSLAPVKTHQVATAANDGIECAPAPITVPNDDPRFAPELVYQTQRVGEGFRYTLPGFTAGRTYTVRSHFAEYVKRPANSDPRSRVRNVGSVQVNVAELAGGILRAIFKDFPGYKADAKGNVIVDSGSYGGPGLCGLEVLDTAGKRLLAINCGGPAVGDFKGESPELVNRNFSFERPGPMAIDKRGDLWIIQRGNDHPMTSALTAKYKAAVKCYKTDGTFTGREFTDLVNPRALGYHAAKDQLLVAENGPDLNVRFYRDLNKSPSLARTFGEPGGIFHGWNPGLVHDPETGGDARFAGIAGVGVDEQGNLYVGGGFQGTALRMFTPEGKLGWMLNSLMFCNTYDVDPASDGSELYGTYNHLHLDLSRTEPGTGQRYISYNWDLRKFGEPERAGNSQAIVRRLGPDKRLVMFTSGQGVIGNFNIYRYDGEIAVPAGGTRDNGSSLWIDTNGNGKVDAGEITKMASPIGGITGLCVDSRGDIWAADTAMTGSFMRHFTFKGVNAAGVPIYSGVKGEGYEDIAFPEEGEKTNGWGMASRMDYDADRDILVAYFPAAARKGEGDKSPPQYLMARYDDWSKGNRKSKWKVKGLRPETDPDYFMYEVKLYPYSSYMGMQIAGDYVFFAYLFGEVHVFDLDTGKLVEILAMGPEVNGQCAWEDAAMGLRAFKTRAGEYLIFTENSGWGGKNNFFRWKP